MQIWKRQRLCFFNSAIGCHRPTYDGWSRACPLEMNIRLPKALFTGGGQKQGQGKLRQVLGLAYKFLKNQYVQELVGEMGTLLVMYGAGFDRPKLNIPPVHGPDYIGNNEDISTYGIFEAKGGKAKLGTTVTASGGTQMSGKWIGYWVDVIANDPKSVDGKALAKAYDKKTPMLAVVTRLNLNPGVPQGRRTLNPFAEQDFREEVRVPTTFPTFHDEAHLLVGMLFE